ncbi:MAG: glycosyltransferase family 2 protein [Nitrospirae bacterium]|nr:glycosyltransferase family 2 protein [Nitrospirota bacterium]
MNNKVSAIIITCNEAGQIERCLKSLSWCDEIIVVDSGSTDGTVDIAKRVADKVYLEEWKGFGFQKQSALDKATCEWVFSIDADEAVTAELSGEILQAVKDDKGTAGFYMPRRNLYGSKWLRFGGQYPDLVLRLFRREAGRFTENTLHERVIVKGECGRLRSPIMHYAFKDLSSMIQKLNDYSTLAAEQMFSGGKRVSALAPLIHSISLGVKDYILRLGFLDGREGFNVALLKSLGVYFKYAKLLELHHKQGSSFR